MVEDMVADKVEDMVGVIMAKYLLNLAMDMVGALDHLVAMEVDVEVIVEGLVHMVAMEVEVEVMVEVITERERLDMVAMPHSMVKVASF